MLHAYLERSYNIQQAYMPVWALTGMFVREIRYQASAKGSHYVACLIQSLQKLGKHFCTSLYHTMHVKVPNPTKGCSTTALFK